MKQAEDIIRRAEAQLSELYQHPVHLQMIVPSDYRVQDIIKTVCSVMDVSIEQIKSSDRHRELIEARHIVIRLTRDNLKFTLTRIGKLLNRDHTTILSSLRQTQNYIDTNDAQFLTNYNKTIQLLNSYDYYTQDTHSTGSTGVQSSTAGHTQPLRYKYQ